MGGWAVSVGTTGGLMRTYIDTSDLKNKGRFIGQITTLLNIVSSQIFDVFIGCDQVRIAKIQ